jgi:hypothetical protein
MQRDMWKDVTDIAECGQSPDSDLALSPLKWIETATRAVKDTLSATYKTVKQYNNVQVWPHPHDPHMS